MALPPPPTPAVIVKRRQISAVLQIRLACGPAFITGRRLCRGVGCGEGVGWAGLTLSQTAGVLHRCAVDGAERADLGEHGHDPRAVLERAVLGEEPGPTQHCAAITQRKKKNKAEQNMLIFSRVEKRNCTVVEH